MKRTTRYVAGSGHLRRITTALTLIVAALISLTAVSCGTQSSQSLPEGQAIEAAIERWRLADMSLRLAPPDQVASIMEQATAWDARRDAAEAEGRHPWVNIAQRESRPVKADMDVWVAFLEPYRDRLASSLTADSPLRDFLPDLYELVDEKEQWGLNNPMTVNGDDPRQLELAETVELRIDEARIDERFSADRLGVVVYLWAGQQDYGGRAWDSWQEWEVILQKESGEWRVADARPIAFGGDDDRSAYGPDSWPHEGSPYPVYEMRTEDHLF